MKEKTVVEYTKKGTVIIYDARGEDYQKHGDGQAMRGIKNPILLNLDGNGQVETRRVSSNK